MQSCTHCMQIAKHPLFEDRRQKCTCECRLQKCICSMQDAELPMLNAGCKAAFGAAAASAATSHQGCGEVPSAQERAHLEGGNVPLAAPVLQMDPHQKLQRTQQGREGSIKLSLWGILSVDNKGARGSWNPSKACNQQLNFWVTQLEDMPNAPNSDFPN